MLQKDFYRVILALIDKYTFQQAPAGSTSNNKVITFTKKKKKSASLFQVLHPIINICVFPFEGELSWQECKCKCKCRTQKRYDLSLYCTEVWKISSIKLVTKQNMIVIGSKLAMNVTRNTVKFRL